MQSSHQMNMPKRMKLDILVYDKRPFLKGKLNGEAALFLLDSGAQDIVLNSRYVNRENANEEGGIMCFTGGPIASFYSEIAEISFGE